ncbi:hypothetical protein NMG60_11008653 [Bertholletia excelsa]
MDEVKKSENHMTCAAAFVEGGIQDACDDACSICLEAFCESDPSTLTSCKHEFHLQCVLEWCQRSSNCPMCWQPISLKDASSQELLEAVERERRFRFNPLRNSTIFRHPTLGDFELQHLQIGANDADLEERILQHLAAAAAMGRGNHIAGREGPRIQPLRGHPQYVVFSTHPNTPSASHISASLVPVGGESEPPALSVTGTGGVDPQQHRPRHISSSSGPTNLPPNERGFSSNNRSQLSLPNQDRAGPSDFQSFSESLKSRFGAMSMKYKETISKSTRGWRERLFSRSSSMADLGSEVRREVNAGIASVSRIMERHASVPNNLVEPLVVEQHNRTNVETCLETQHNGSNAAAVSTTSVLH